MSLSRRTLLLAGVAAVGSAAALSNACAPTPPPTPNSAAAPTSAPTAPPASAPTTSPPSPTSAPTATPPAIALLKIGALLPYNESSIGVDVGLNQKRAADLYLKQHGGKLGGRPVSLVYSSESAESGINKVKLKTLLETDKVELLMGGVAADAAYVMRDAADTASIVYIDTNATANSLTRSIGDCQPSCKSKHVFRTSASSWQLSEPLGEWASRSGVKEFYVSYVDETFGTESADAFEAGLARNGGKATGRGAAPNGGDWSKVVAAIGAQVTRNVFAAFHTDDAEGFLSAWDKQGMRAAGYRLYGPGPLTEEEVLNQTKGAAEGTVTAHFWSTELDNAENKALLDAFAREYTDDETGEPVILTGYAVQMWDAMTALDAALTRTRGNTRDGDALIAALENVSFRSPRGAFAFDTATHNPVQDIYVREVRRSNVKPVNVVLDQLPTVTDPGT